MPLLEVKNLRTEFRTGAGIVRAVDGISYTVEPGETVAVVGESGSGKSVSALSLLRLIPDPPGRITGGEVLFAGRNLLQISEAEMRQHRKYHGGQFFQLQSCGLEPEITYTIGVLKCSNDIVFFACRTIFEQKGGAINSNGKVWPDTEARPDRSSGCTENLEIEMVWRFKYDLSPCSTYVCQDVPFPYSAMSIVVIASIEIKYVK